MDLVWQLSAVYTWVHCRSEKFNMMVSWKSLMCTRKHSEILNLVFLCNFCWPPVLLLLLAPEDGCSWKRIRVLCFFGLTSHGWATTKKKTPLWTVLLYAELLIKLYYIIRSMPSYIYIWPIFCWQGQSCWIMCSISQQSKTSLRYTCMFRPTTTMQSLSTRSLGSK
jgi:hypothetical protein